MSLRRALSTMSKENESEKGDVVMIERAGEADPSRAELDGLPEIGTPERILAERKLVRKLNFRLLPTIFLIYIMNYIDRNGITTARLKGLEQDLGLSDLQYSVVLSILFVSYCPAQIPSNMILNWISRPSWYIGVCVMGWGLTSLLTGVTKNYGGIMACRVFIGLPEAAFYPGAIYLLSRWYTKKAREPPLIITDGHQRMTDSAGISFSLGDIVHRLPSLQRIRRCYSSLPESSQTWKACVGFGLGDGTVSIHTVYCVNIDCRLFFIEGAITITVGIFTLWALPDYPNNTRWIVGDERRLAQARLAEDAGEADQDNENDTPLAGLKMALTDPLILAFAVMNAAQLLGLSFINFCESLATTLGFNTTISLLLAAPPWLIASLVTGANAWHADKTGERFFHVAGWWWPVMVGFIISLCTANVGARYFSMFLMAIGYAGVSMTAVWVSNVIPRPPAKRAAAIGVVNGIGNLGNLMGSYTWKAAWGPEYHQSMIISLCSLALSSVMAVGKFNLHSKFRRLSGNFSGIRRHLVRKNKQLDEDKRVAMQDADEIRVKEAAILEGITFEQAMERRKGFRYLA
ncbi:Tartrate transporter [Mycena venus]|uniref:Tartrate transporter n=1 Tax=Mycena venus TaxID=2733690 RepID=A0A8H6YX43_9AGAR|nr:Tartrate transporter [Mycena venus]